MTSPLFSPGSVFWRVNRELISGLAAPRAVLMQIAHPLIAAGVAEHSRYRKHRFARLYRTSLAAVAITFGPREFAQRAVDTINKIHTRVHGVLRQDVGPFPAGTPYDANDPELKLWVLSTITESTLDIYELFASPLTGEEREQYYRDSLIATKLFDIPDSLVPQTYSEFRTYMDDMMASGQIQVGEDARNIVAGLFSPSPGGKLLYLGSMLGIGRLPESLKQEYGFQWTGRREAWLQRSAALSMRMHRYIPTVFLAHPVATISGLIAGRKIEHAVG